MSWLAGAFPQGRISTRSQWKAAEQLGQRRSCTPLCAPVVLRCDSPGPEPGDGRHPCEGKDAN